MKPQDASHCQQTGAAGFGFWCVSDRGKLAGGKPLNGKIKDSYEAEAKGVANSIVIGFRSGIIQQGDTVIIQLDNIAVVFGINGKLKKKRKDEKTNTLTTVQKDNVAVYEDMTYRKLTPLECERLQTLPDNWTSVLSNTQRYKSIGNGWCIDVIAHILKHI